MTRRRLSGILAAAVAVNYFAFRVELFEEEYESNSPKLPDRLSYSKYSTNWETFDKDNAPKAFSFSGEAKIEFICFTEREPREILESYGPCEPVRDKSPPYLLSI